jgi:hypothetical protein
MPGITGDSERVVMVVPAHIEAAVIAFHDVPGVLRVDPDRVLIDVPRLAVAA